MDKEAGQQFIQTVPVRMTVDVSSVRPLDPKPEQEPLVKVRVVVDLSPSPKEKTFPIWFDAEVQIFDDLTSEILSFVPMHGGALHGTHHKRLVTLYQHAFARALVRSKLRILGVER
jgi:hypothetical protein